MARKPIDLDPQGTGDMAIDVGNRLRLTRKAIARKRGLRKLSQKDFAAGADILQSGYSMVESGKRPLSLHTALLLCDAYNISLDWIFRGDPAGLPAWLLRSIQDVEAEEAKQRRRQPRG